MSAPEEESAAAAAVVEEDEDSSSGGAAAAVVASSSDDAVVLASSTSDDDSMSSSGGSSTNTTVSTTSTISSSTASSASSMDTLPPPATTASSLSSESSDSPTPDSEQENPSASSNTVNSSNAATTVISAKEEDFRANAASPELNAVLDGAETTEQLKNSANTVEDNNENSAVQHHHHQQQDPPEEKTENVIHPPSGLADGTSGQTSNNSLANKNNPAVVVADDEDDVTSKAAVALAAVAAAATANHKSPAEAAAQARAVAQTFLTSSGGGNETVEDAAGIMGMIRSNNSNAADVWRRVSFRAVQTQLQQRAAEQATPHNAALTQLLQHLAASENACFLQHLLLLEYFQCDPDEEETAKKNAEPPFEAARGDDPPEVSVADSEAKQKELAMADLAAERLVSVIKKIEGAYESMLNLLPHRNNNQQHHRTPADDVLDDSGLVSLHNKPPEDPHHSSKAGGKKHYRREKPVAESYETPIVVPDLLPPCTTVRGDSTLAFFRACTARVHEPQPTMAALPPDNAADSNLSESAASSTGALTEETEQALKAAARAANAKTAAAAAASPGRAAAVSSLLGSMFRRSVASPDAKGKASAAASAMFSSAFRRKGKHADEDGDPSSQQQATLGTDSTNNSTSTGTEGGGDAHNVGLRPGEYAVKIEREMLGLTVENVLERTVVRTVLAGGPAKKAGAKVGSLIVKVGNIETKNLTHFETIDELRQSQRPLLLVLKQLSEESLRAAREEMGRLIRGAGFGTVMDSNGGAAAAHQASASATSAVPPPSQDGNSNSSSNTSEVRPLIAADLRLDAFTSFLRRRLAANAQHGSKKDEGVARAADKLIWILTLFVFGLEREVKAMDGSPDENDEQQQQHGTSHLHQHTLKEYTDSAKSVGKVLLEFTRKRIDPSHRAGGNNNAGMLMSEQARRRKGGPPPPPPPQPGRGRGRGGAGRGMVGGRGSPSQQDSNIAHEKPLLQIGDVLQRTRTFLADTTSPPAALLRGEVIALLCDILDVDTETELSEEESISATASSGGGGGGPINDLGSAGSLLKLIVLNCPIMRSPICEELAGSPSAIGGGEEWAEELRRKLGNKEKYSSNELHRLHAGNRFLAVVHRLAASRSMSARITACSLGPVIWGHLDFPHQLQLRGVITRALHDVEVMVRKATANVLHEIAELVFDARCVPWLVLMCERSMTDPEPQMRSAAMTLTWHLAEHLPNTFLGDASQGSRYLRRLPDRSDPIFADVYLLQCKLLPVATRLAEDRSPSVRLAVAAQCDRLCDALGDHWSSVVIDVLLGLLSDPDERVRCEAVMCVPRLAGIVLLSSPPGASVSEVSILEALVPASIRLQSDSVAVVRVALASAAGELLTLLVALQSRVEEASPPAAAVEDDGFRRYKKQVDERLIPLVQSLLNDQDPEVTSAALRAVTNASRRSTATISSRHRLPSAASALDDDSASVTSLHSHASRENPKQPVFLPVLSEVQVLRLLPTLTELADSKQWRVRQSAVEIVPALLGCTQKLETRTEISKLCARLMSDKVDEVRKTAAECLCMGGSSLGSHGDEDASSEWFYRIVIPILKGCATHAISKQRLLSLKMVEILLLHGAYPNKISKQHQASGDQQGEAFPAPTSELVILALTLCNDRIANVRLNVGRVLESVLHVLGGDVEDLALIVQGVGGATGERRTARKTRSRRYFLCQALPAPGQGNAAGRSDRQQQRRRSNSHFTVATFSEQVQYYGVFL